MKKNMKKDMFTYLPPEVIMEILTRLPAQYILRCKCVCKSWHRLFETCEFAKLHLSKSVPGLALTIKPKSMDKFVELTNVLDIQHHNLDDLHFSTIIKLYFSGHASIQGSADGLLLLRVAKRKRDYCKPDLYLCNPITRECIDLLHSHSQPIDSSKGLIMYGFGVTKKTGKYKALSILYNQPYSPTPECKVYTIGTGLWRSITPHVVVDYYLYHHGVFVNGNLHWMARDLNGTPCISWLDLETELFNTFSLPPRNEKTRFSGFVVAMEDNLCACEHTRNPDVMIIWFMKEYGVDKSWTKEFNITRGLDLRSMVVYPVKVSVDGVILMAYDHESLVYYFNKNKTVQIIPNFRGGVYMSSFSHISSFISLKSFVMEKSVSFF